EVQKSRKIRPNLPPLPTVPVTSHAASTRDITQLLSASTSASSSTSEKKADTAEPVDAPSIPAREERKRWVSSRTAGKNVYENTDNSDKLPEANVRKGSISIKNG